MLLWSGDRQDIWSIEPVPFIPQGSLPEQVEEKTQRGTG